jgi:hypothetical protein
MQKDARAIIEDKKMFIPSPIFNIVNTEYTTHTNVTDGDWLNL